MQNITTMLEKYGRYNRLIGDYRSCHIRAELGTRQHRDAREALERYMAKLAKLENTMEDLGLLSTGDRHSNRGDA